MPPRFDLGTELTAPLTLSLAQVRRLRLRAQGLDARGSVDLVDALRQTCGLQAQEEAAAVLGLRARSALPTAADVRRARVKERSLVWTWCMRGTLHFVAAEDARWLLSLHGPVFARANARRRAVLGYDGAAAARGVRAIRDLIEARGPQTRSDVAAHLAGIGLPSEGQATIHVLLLAALDAHIVRGPSRGSEPEYVLLDDWIPPAEVPARIFPPEEALAALARRYLAAYGPATAEDFRAWCGLPSGDVRTAWTAILSELTEFDTAIGPASMLASDVARLDERASNVAPVRLLPRFDNYLLGYRSRAFAVAPEHAKRVHPGGGIIHATVLVDGRVAGLWRMTRRAKRLTVAIDAFEPFDERLRAELQREVADIGRFLDAEAVVADTG